MKQEKKPYEASYAHKNFRAGVSLNEDGRVEVTVDQKDGTDPETWSTWDPLTTIQILKRTPAMRRVYESLETARRVYEAMKGPNPR